MRNLPVVDVTHFKLTKVSYNMNAEIKRKMGYMCINVKQFVTI